MPLEDWKAYLRWYLIHGLVSMAPKALVDEDFAFFGKRLDGQASIAARWKRCVDATEDQLGDALGEAYVEREFNEDDETARARHDARDCEGDARRYQVASTG